MPSIYIIKSKTSGKCYIGQTNSTAEKRWKKHLIELRRREGCSALYSAIKKYGVDDFEVKTLLQGSFTKEVLNELEKQEIKRLKTLSPNGYNLQTGGNSFNLPQEVRDKISKANTGRQIKWAKKISKGVKKLWDNPDYKESMRVAHTHKRGKYKK